MTPKRQREFLQSELASLKRLFATTPEDPITTPLMASRMERVQSALLALEAGPPAPPEAELFFSDGPALDSDGLEVTFTSDILGSYQIMVTNHYSAKHYGELRRTGRRRGEDETQLYLTALPRGSFGLQLAQLHVSDFITANQVAEAMKDISGLLQAAGTSDEAFDSSLAQFNPRVLPPLTEFITTLHTGGGACRVVTGFTETTLTEEQVTDAYTRISAATKEEEVLILRGVFGGLTLFDWEFNFQPDQGTVISGSLAQEVTEEEATAMNLTFTGKRSIAKVKTVTVTTRSGKKKPSYELLELRPIEEVAAPAATRQKK